VLWLARVRTMERRLAAIIAADVVGYSRLMEQDEAATFERLRQIRTELVEPTVAQHRGRIFKLLGDGLLAEFGSALDAVECAAAIQRGMRDANREGPDARRIEWRIGMHVGEVIVEGDDLHGEAVNMAARLQEMAEPRGICVSRRVMELARQKVAVGFEFRGEERLKNIAEPVGVFAVRLDGATTKQSPPLGVKIFGRLAPGSLYLGLLQFRSHDSDDPCVNWGCAIFSKAAFGQTFDRGDAVCEFKR
jgi:class 3 adenylate cyclase